MLRRSSVRRQSLSVYTGRGGGGTYFENSLINCSKVGTYVTVDKINKVINCVLGV